MKQEQQDLFLDWNNKCNELRDLSSFIQNDFDRLLADGHTTPEEIIELRSEFFKQYVCLLTDIEVLYKKIYDLMSEYQPKDLDTVWDNVMYDYAEGKLTRKEVVLKLKEALEQEN
jgi:RNAse (barnase) inhibitor barstar